MILSYLFNIIFFVCAFFIHEFTKVATANYYSTGYKNKFNYKKIIEPVGLIFAVLFNVGWSNQAEINTLYIKDRNKNLIFIYSSGIVINILIGIFFIVISSFLPKSTIINPKNFYILLQYYCIKFAYINLVVAFTNIIPMPQLSGYKIFMDKASSNAKVKLMSYERILQIVFAFTIMFGIARFSINIFINPIINLFSF